MGSLYEFCEVNILATLLIYMQSVKRKFKGLDGKLLRQWLRGQETNSAIGFAHVP